MTGDENIVEVNFTVTWKVKNAGDFLFNVRDPESTVRTAAESAMRDSIGVTPIMEIIADDRKGVQERAEKRCRLCWTGIKRELPLHRFN